MAWAAPTVAEFKAYFARDFNYAPAEDASNLDFIVDADITKALRIAAIHFNTGLFGDDANITDAFMNLVAFYLCVSLQNSAKGISSQAKFPINSTSVGGVSISFSLPEEYAKDAYLSSLTQNGYGMMYLSLLVPVLRGGINLIGGTTTPV